MISKWFRKIAPQLELHQQQTNTIVFITFWSQFSVYTFNTILVLFLTKPIIVQGLGYSETKAYAFLGVSHAMGYLTPMLGGYMADTVVGVRRSILIGSFLLALAYLFVMLSGFTVMQWNDTLFLAAYALVPATNSLLMGTSSSMVSHIYSDDAIKAKSAMTFYYIAINVGALIATLIAPILLESRYGPLSILAVAFVGKSIAALNFAHRYRIYDSVIWGSDLVIMSSKKNKVLILYLLILYVLTLFAYSHVYLASMLISAGCIGGIVWFFQKSIKLSGIIRIKQLIALFLILEAIIFFVIFNQMNSTLILFAQNNSDHHLFGMSISPAQYQMINPILILVIGSQLPRFYKWAPRFTIPYQFAAGIIISGFALLLMAFAAWQNNAGLVNGNYIAITYVLISIAELWVSAIGLSMIGLYCDQSLIAFAMGVWYLASSLSHVISGSIAAWVAIPENVHNATISLYYYQSYYFFLGMGAIFLGIFMYVGAFFLTRIMNQKHISLG